MGRLLHHLYTLQGLEAADHPSNYRQTARLPTSCWTRSLPINQNCQMSQNPIFLPLRECSRSDWYVSPEHHRCPHDAWVEAVTISEPASGERHQDRELQIQIRLLGAYHDGIIEFTYRHVQNYSFEGSGITGHGDWLRDEVEERN